MSIPTHYLHVYQRPKAGTTFLKRFPMYNYQHSISNMGWFDTASCDIAVRSASEGKDILDHYLGCRVAVFVDNPITPVWEGFINRIIFNSGGASYTISLDELANRVSIVFTATGNVGSQNAPTDDTNSQAIYGIKQDQIEFGADPTSASPSNQRQTLRNTILAQRAYPQSSFSQAQGQTNVAHFELLGFYHTLEWEKLFTATATTTTAASTKITTLLAALGNGSTFFNNADTSLINTNTTLVPDQQRGASYWELFQKIAEAGDSTNYWIIGITPTNPNTKTRALYYRQANFNTLYSARQADGLRIRSIYGKVIPAWQVVPDGVIRVSDALIGTSGNVVTDPTLTYIQSIQYDANSQRVQWFGADDTTARAAFMLKRSFKPLSRNQPGSAPTRVIVT